MKYYRLGLYDPCEPDKRPKLLSPVFNDMPEDRRHMESAIYHYNLWAAKRPNVVMVMGVFRVKTVLVEKV